MSPIQFRVERLFLMEEPSLQLVFCLPGEIRPYTKRNMNAP
jgi:hypothetical protein